ncbi:MAG: M56 family metallopeptidase [Prevotella sp.]|nr:M56 family metallopeptidase [Prevotella sp.]
MMEFLIYDLKVAALVAVFYMFYRLLLSRETFHTVNRVVLLLTAVASFLLPLCVITIHQTVEVPMVEGTVSAGRPVATLVDEPDMPWWQRAALGIFLAGIVAALAHQLWSLAQVVRIIRHSERHPQADGTVVCVTDSDQSPFSWLRYIVLSRNDYDNLNPAVMAHERGHIRRHHTLDLLLVDTLTALQWFNPAMWMLRQDLRAIHEYEADAAVLSHGINMRQYQYLLIQKAVSDCGYSVVNGISHSTLKNRITMMLHKKSSRASLLKLLALLPIVGTTLALQAETVNDYVYQQPPKKIVKKGSQDATIVLNGQTIEVRADENVASAGQGLKPIVVGSPNTATDPLIVIDGQVATAEQMKALDPKAIDNVSVVKDEETKVIYAQHFNADTSNGIIFINTKEYVERGGKGVVAVSVKVPAKSTEEQEPFDMVEQMPEFPGGVQALMQFLYENIRYPEAAQTAGKEGRVVVQFVVEADGAVSSAKVVRSISEELDAEALRVVNAMPRWTPGKHKGKAVRVKYTLPVSFRLTPKQSAPATTEAKPQV